MLAPPLVDMSGEEDAPADEPPVVLPVPVVVLPAPLVPRVLLPAPLVDRSGEDVALAPPLIDVPGEDVTLAPPLTDVSLLLVPALVLVPPA